MGIKKYLNHLLSKTLPLTLLAASACVGATDVYQGTLDGIYLERNEIVIDDVTLRLDSGLVVHLSEYRRGTVTDLIPGKQVKFTLAPSSGKPGEIPRTTEIWVLQKAAQANEE
ncbi:MAG TPA: hypothetical protein EYH03_04830 [Chromatiales bacterium]|nr:hypothetical protein [Chromatiales bacterium]